MRESHLLIKRHKFLLSKRDMVYSDLVSSMSFKDVWESGKNPGFGARQGWIQIPSPVVITPSWDWVSQLNSESLSLAVKWAR